MNWDKKFVPQFVDFVNKNFPKEHHLFVIYGGGATKDLQLPQAPNLIHYPILLKKLLPIINAMRVARKVILHGLFSSHLLYLLMLQPWLLKKCYWTIWGGDLYIHKARHRGWRWYKDEILRCFVIPRLGHLITHIKGDYKLAQKWYGGFGQWHDCFMYPSNLYFDYRVPSKESETVNIIVGNSADPSNNHQEVFEKLKSFRDHAIKIYVPLSYGDKRYAEKIIACGTNIFGSKFFPLLNFMPVEEYVVFLANIDIAIFNHRRQQGIGNITTLLGLGAKVYMRSDVTTWDTFNKLGLTVFDFSSIDLCLLGTDKKIANKEILKKEFSRDSLTKKLSSIFCN